MPRLRLRLPAELGAPRRHREVSEPQNEADEDAAPRVQRWFACWALARSD